MRGDLRQRSEILGNLENSGEAQEGAGQGQREMD